MPADNVLLLPGMMCDERLWARQARDLPQTLHYADTSHAADFATMAEQVLAAAPERFAVAGLSMGGILAFEIWRRAPRRVTHLALLDTNPHADTPARRSLRLQQIETALAGGLRDLAIESLKPLYLAESQRDNDELLQRILDMALDLGPGVFERQSLALRDRVDSVPTLASIDCPTLVLCGDEDVLCPPEYHEFMAERILDAELCIVPDCGHLSSLERPDVVTRELTKLFSR